ncbi:MAG: hypothetical protein R3272_00370 [Candidatus Promineifilaceae bacterium]|nr:hypothetical protein [Candidatus Promineifilaceae bacterium]
MEEATQAEAALVAALHDGLGDQLHSIYRLPTVGEGYFLPERQQATLVVIVAGARLHEVRRAFLPVWREHAAALGAPPLLIQQRALQRYLHLFPLFGRHLERAGTRLLGEDTALPVVEPPSEDGVAFAAQQTMLASALLGDLFLTPEQEAAAQLRLNRLARILDLEIPEGESVGERFCRVQEALEPMVAGEPPENPAPPGNAGSFGSAIVAVYEDHTHLTLVAKRNPTDLLGALNWGIIGRRMYQGGILQLATVPQLKLIFRRERPLDLLLRNLDHLHGVDVLAGVDVAEAMVFRHAARTPSMILVREMPAAYLIADGREDVHQVIHDYQNRLLNVHLRQELLHRIHGLAPTEPPIPLPDRDAPLDERVEAIADQLNWWVEHYATALS